MVVRTLPASPHEMFLLGSGGLASRPIVIDHLCVDNLVHVVALAVFHRLKTIVNVGHKCDLGGSHRLNRSGSAAFACAHKVACTHAHLIGASLFKRERHRIGRNRLRRDLLATKVQLRLVRSSRTIHIPAERSRSVLGDLRGGRTHHGNRGNLTNNLFLMNAGVCLALRNGDGTNLRVLLDKERTRVERTFALGGIRAIDGVPNLGIGIVP